MAEHRWWVDQLSAAPRPSVTLSLVTPLQLSPGGSGAFLGLASDGLEYWIKPAQNPQGIKTLGAEVIVAAIGQSLGAPVRPVSLISVPESLQTWPYRDHYVLNDLPAHASLDLGKAFVALDWEHTEDDHNSVRQALLYVLWDLCLGGDPQWLHDVDRDLSIWSFDHGFWLGGDGDWDAATLIPIGDRAWQYDLDLADMSSTGLRDASAAVRSLTDSQILTAISGVPLEWGIPIGDLGAVGWLLSERREAVAGRALQLADSVIFP
ncbi:MAG TPA: HipA family kinase [Pseudolysinimonas sp.]|nr:HipA family kinase [Pseudolysinimonas sp.]